MPITHKKKTILIFIIFLTIITLQSNGQQIVSKVVPCLQYKNRQCIRCPETAHLYDQQCYQNIANCAEYQYGTCSAICKNSLDSSQSQISSLNPSTVTKTNTS